MNYLELSKNIIHLAHVISRFCDTESASGTSRITDAYSINGYGEVPVSDSMR